jgi:hypothetical protein
MQLDKFFKETESKKIFYFSYSLMFKKKNEESFHEFCFKKAEIDDLHNQTSITNKKSLNKSTFA